jgi:hypothetical protein
LWLALQTLTLSPLMLAPPLLAAPLMWAFLLPTSDSEPEPRRAENLANVAWNSCDDAHAGVHPGLEAQVTATTGARGRAVAHPGMMAGSTPSQLPKVKLAGRGNGIGKARTSLVEDNKETRLSSNVAPCADAMVTECLCSLPRAALAHCMATAQQGKNMGVFLRKKTRFFNKNLPESQQNSMITYTAGQNFTSCSAH